MTTPVIVNASELLTLIVLFVISIGWLWAARRRLEFKKTLRRRRQKARDDDDDDDDNDDDDDDDDAPTVAVVLPVRGASRAKLKNWFTQVSTKYEGKVIFVFSVEGETDLAGKYVNEYVKKLCFESENDDDEDGIGIRRLRERELVVVQSGKASKCSQKIRQQLRGVEFIEKRNEELLARRQLGKIDNTKTTMIKYVLFLDDDVMLFPSTIGTLVNAMEADEREEGSNKALMATGYPLDFIGLREEEKDDSYSNSNSNSGGDVGGGSGGGIGSSASFANYLTFVYHLPLLIPFSHGKYAKNVWGGCMLFRVSEFSSNVCKIKEAYENGGYSDDLIVAAAADRDKRRILCPGNCLFPMPLNPNQKFSEWVNYFHRQVFVNDTYFDKHMKMINHFMLFAMFASSIFLMSGTYASAFEIIKFCLFHFMPRIFYDDDDKTTMLQFPWLAVTVFIFHFIAMMCAKAMYASSVSLCEETTKQEEEEEEEETQRRQRRRHKSSTTTTKTTPIRRPPLQSSSPSDIARKHYDRTSWFKLWLALCLAYTLAPFFCAYVLLTNTVVWAGITYRKSKGKVCVVPVLS